MFLVLTEQNIWKLCIDTGIYFPVFPEREEKIIFDRVLIEFPPLIRHFMKLFTLLHFFCEEEYPSRHEMSLRCLKQISIERDILKTSQKYLKRDVFFETSLRLLKYISRKMSFLRRL